MIRFLLSFLAVYGGIHLYVFSRAVKIISQTPVKHRRGILVFWMSAMTLSPLAVRILENSGRLEAARFLAWPSYIWMGFVFIFCTALVFSDVFLLTSFLLSKSGLAVVPRFKPGYVYTLALAVSVAASCYSFYEAGRITVEKVEIRTEKLFRESKPIRIVQISDVHVGLLLWESRLERIMEEVRNARPDILVSTGDLADGRLSREDIREERLRLARQIATLEAPLGRFAVMGNHEYYMGSADALEFTALAGFRVLRGESFRARPDLMISGFDDQHWWGERNKAVKAKKWQEEAGVLDAVPGDLFHLLLKHRPVVPEVQDGKFDLQLSGHVHKGQIFPFNLLTRLEFDIPCGTTKTPKGSTVHVSRGSGTWGPPMRLLAPPEVTVIDIVPVRESGLISGSSQRR